ncbi:MAG: MAPEG family protein [Rubrivivax sp.]
MNPKPDTAILAPVFALAAWTALILLLVAGRRVAAALRGRAAVQDFALGEAPQLPPSVVLANRNYMNLLELPLLFYVGCLAALVTSNVSPALLRLAWAYVALRVVHSLIHVGYNRVSHRFAAFAASNGVLVAFWVVLGLRVFAGPV